VKQHDRKNAWGIGVLVIALIGSFMLFGSSSRAQVTRFAVGQQVTAVVDLWLHSGDDINSPNLIVMKPGQPATVTGAPGYGWYPLDYQGYTGWASGKYLQPYTGTPAPTGVPTTPIAPGQPTPSPAATKMPTSTTTPTPLPQIVTTTRKVEYPYRVPTTANSQGIMLGMMKGGNIHSAPNSAAPVITWWWYGRKVMVYGSVVGASVNGNNVWYIVGKPPERDQFYYVHSSLVTLIEPILVPQPQYRMSGHWIDVNLSQQSLTAFDGQAEMMHTLISSGTSTHPTAIGYWKIYYRLVSQEMRNPDSRPGEPGWYDLPGVPYPQYFYATGEAIHGTYWHDNFGTPMSHGCVNATIPAARWLYYNFTDIGTPVFVHF
jgi:L,D-transpeptidase catalytic domain/Bacterial SH3 domain